MIMPNPEIKVKQLDNRRPSLLIRILAFRNNPIIKANRPNVRIKKKISSGTMTNSLKNPIPTTYAR
ncbi:hypothetical protein J41TS8_25240 [Bacillus sp. J41TS8]|nr:hypothetical protein J41TS8_25240 [Bacillus sp. J41TS8]